MIPKTSVATKGGGYNYGGLSYSGQSLSDEKYQSLSAKVWNSGTTFLNSSPNIMHDVVWFT